MTNATHDLSSFWDWKRKHLIVQMMKGTFRTWSEFESFWHEIEYKIDEYPDKKSAIFSDYIYWKTKGKPIITDIIPDASHLKSYYDNCLTRRLKSSLV